MKGIKIFIVSIVLVFSLCGCSFISEFENMDKFVYFSEKSIGISYDNGKEISSYDDHGFFGEGLTYNVYQFTENPITEDVISNNHWHKLPFTQNISLILYGGTYDDGLWGASITMPNEDEPLVPKIEHGYYYFYDRHSESKDSADDTEVFNRSSFNFVVAVYDIDTNKLYYARYDT